MKNDNVKFKIFLMKSALPIFAVCCLLFIVLLPLSVLAEDCDPPDCKACSTTIKETQCRHESLFQQGGYAITSPTATIPARIGITVNLIMSVTGVIFLVIVVFSGIQWMTAGGNEEMVKKSRNRIEKAVIGLIIVVGSWAIVNFVLGSLLFPGQSGSSGFFNLNINSLF